MESWLLAQKAYIDAINADICGMVASNHYRLGRGETIAYGSTAFHDKAEELRGIGDQIMKNR